MKDASQPNWQRADEVFREALALPPDERDRYIADALGHDPKTQDAVRTLLAADEQAGDFLEKPAAVIHDLALDQPQHDDLVHGHVGDYEVLRLIASGGMGDVYEATQQRPHRAVALKVMRQGLRTSAARRRFEFEGQVLGRLQHQGIAQIFEAGIADTEHGPLPFFAMELIRGLPLGDYAAANDLHVNDRLMLMARICEAVHHAHQHGVIHRDLKPDNILVNDGGQPKVLDFGIARATDCDINATTLRTDIGQLIGTLPYMSPEQVEGDPTKLDIRSDVYSLGVICYEVLAGRLPYDLHNKALPEAVRVIREEEPDLLRTSSRVHRSDADTILAKALEKDRDRRYASASELAADIMRLVRDEPISARPPSAMYQLGKFARRNKPLVGGFAATISALLLGLALTTRATLRARTAEQEANQLAATATEQRNEAQRAAATSKAVTLFLQNVLAASDPEGTLGSEASVRDALDQAAQRVDRGELADQPAVQAAVCSTVGTTYHNLGLYDKAEKYFRRALDTFKRAVGEENPETLQTMNNLGYLLSDRGNLEEAESLLRAACSGFERTLGPDHAERLTALNNLSVTLTKKGDIAGAAAISKEVLDARSRTLGAEHPQTLLSMNNLGVVYMRLGRLDEAESWIRQALEGRRKALGAKHPRTIITLDNLALVLQDQGRLDEAEQTFRESAALFDEVRGPEHPDTLIATYSLAGLLHKRGSLDEAESLFRQTLAIRRRVLGDEHADTLYTMRHLAAVLVDQERLADAEAVFEEAVAIIQRTEPESPAFVYKIPMFYGRFLAEQQRFAEAETVMLYGYEEWTRRVPADHRNARTARGWMNEFYTEWGKPDRALAYSQADPQLPGRPAATTTP